MAASGRYGPILACQGIVGRADLTTGAAVEEVLALHVACGGGRFKGIRHSAAWDASPQIRRSHTSPPEGLYGLEAFREGFARLAPLGLSFDAWQYHAQLPELTDLARAFPETPIVLDHVGGPLGIGPYEARRAEVFEAWRRDIRELSRCDNVWVKLGGLGMPICGFGLHKRETPAGSEELARLWAPYIETCIEVFGTRRSMFESNFPVDKVSCDYRTLWNAFKRLAAGASESEKKSLFRESARTFYRLT
jgi:predicted TIM-barrel fold metal-dependent hydrolase